jgi:hypothetical protein
MSRLKAATSDQQEAMGFSPDSKSGLVDWPFLKLLPATLRFNLAGVMTE